MYTFAARIEIIGINPYVLVPDEVLDGIFAKANRNKSPIPVHGLIDGVTFTQTLVRYAGDWRLYVNTTMLKHSQEHVGDIVALSMDFDPSDRTLPIHPMLQTALDNDPHARQVFDSLSPSRQHEINRYIANLKTEAKAADNVQRAVDFLNGKGRFVGRDAQ